MKKAEVDRGKRVGVPTEMPEKLKTVLEVGQLRADAMSRMKETYAALAIEPDHTRYGWMRVRV